VTINATGAAVDRLLNPLNASTQVPMLKAMNLVTRREAGDAALGGRSASGRNLFLVPWRGRALFGTWESASACSPDDRGVAAADVAAFIAEVNEAFPSLSLGLDDVTLVHHGVVPAMVTDGRISLEGHEQIRDHAREGLDGIMSVVGAKYTTARGAAERVTDRLLTMLARPPVPCRTATTALPGGNIRDLALTVAVARRDSDVDRLGDTVPHLIAAYGSRYGEILGLCAERPDLRERLAADSPVIGAEIVWAVRHEMAATLADAVVRRTPLGALGYPGDAAIERAAAIIATELGWSAEQRSAEKTALKTFYA
jgi:glycerol-3-phosphate dehydrogenase